MSSRPPVLVTAEAADYLRARVAWEAWNNCVAPGAEDDKSLATFKQARSAWQAVGKAVDALPTDGGPLTLHGYRPEHGDPLAWAAEQIEEAATTIRELRNDIGALTAANATLLDALRTSGEVFSVRRWILERFFGKG